MLTVRVSDHIVVSYTYMYMHVSLLSAFISSRIHLIKSDELQHLCFTDNEISLDDLRFLTRMHYKAGSDKMWGEHEIDYVMFMQKAVTLQPNASEVKDCWYASQAQVKELLQKAAEDPNTLVTPWFKMIAHHFLFTWWENLNDLSQFENDREIHKMAGVPV